MIFFYLLVVGSKLENVLLLGDFNIWVDDCSSSIAMELLTLTETFNFEQHVSGPTHQKGHTLDLVFSLGLNVANLCVEDVHLSDHSCVLFDLILTTDSVPLEIRSQRRIITEDTADRLSAMFDPHLCIDCLDCGLFHLLF